MKELGIAIKATKRERSAIVPTMMRNHVAPETDSGDHDRSPDFVRSLERGRAVILAFGPGRPGLTLAEVAKEAGLTRVAARCFLLKLVDLGYVRNEGRLFSLRPLALALNTLRDGSVIITCRKWSSAKRSFRPNRIQARA